MSKKPSRPLWSGRFADPVAPALAALSRSLDFDRKLWAEEIASTKAHARALERAGILTEEERSAIESKLEEAASAFEKESFEFDAADEDIHSALERFLIDNLGEAGAKIHAGRSRNDLVVTDLRLWLKRRIPQIAGAITELQKTLLRQSHDNLETPIPGYTHLQRAQAVLLPHLLLAHGFALARDFERMTAAHRRSDVSPLGAGALAGTSLPLDPLATARDLGFAAVFDNAADAVSDRDFALEFLAAGAILGVHLSRLAEDVILWTSSEFGFATLDDAYATGSSIMPQKKNPDIAELTRAKSARLVADLVHLLGAMKGLPLTYNRDLQEDKEPVFDAAETLALLLAALGGAMQTITFNTQAMRAAAAGSGMLATDLAEALVLKGLPFRAAHEAVGRLIASAGEGGKQLEDLGPDDLDAAGPPFSAALAEILVAESSVARRTSHGGTSPERIREQLVRFESVLGAQTAWLNEKRQ